MKDPIFVIGSPRSGTSLLYYLIAAHPSLMYPDIGTKNILRDRRLRLLDNAGMPVLSNSGIHARHLPAPGETPFEEGLKFLGLDPLLPQEGDFMWQELIARYENTVGAYANCNRHTHPILYTRIRRRYESLLKRHDLTRIIDKSPQFTVMLDVIRALYPDAYIVHIVRDGRAVVNSIAYAFKYRKKSDGSPWAHDGFRWWGPRPSDWRDHDDKDPVTRACHQWSSLIAEGRRAADLFPGRYHEIRYEDLVHNTAENVARIQAFCGLSAGEVAYPDHLEDRNYKWKNQQAQSFGDTVWTDRCAIGQEDRDSLEIIRPKLESLGYVSRGESLVPGEAVLV